MIFHDLLQDGDIVIGEKYRIIGFDVSENKHVTIIKKHAMGWLDDSPSGAIWSPRGFFHDRYVHNIINRKLLSYVKGLLTNKAIRIVPV